MFMRSIIQVRETGRAWQDKPEHKLYEALGANFGSVPHQSSPLNNLSPHGGQMWEMALA